MLELTNEEISNGTVALVDQFYHGHDQEIAGKIGPGLIGLLLPALVKDDADLAFYSGVYERASASEEKYMMVGIVIGRTWATSHTAMNYLARYLGSEDEALKFITVSAFKATKRMLSVGEAFIHAVQGRDERYRAFRMGTNGDYPTMDQILARFE